MQFPNISICAAAAGYCWFLENLSEVPFTSRCSSRFDWHSFAQFLAWRSLLWLFMTWRQRFLTRKYFLCKTSLTWSLALHLLFCSVRWSPLLWKEINTKTTTQPPPTHTHTYTQTHYVYMHTRKHTTHTRHIHSNTNTYTHRHAITNAPL